MFTTGNLTVNESSKTRLFCNASGNPLPTTNWILPNASIVNNTHLQFDNTSKTQHGKYVCQAVNIIGNVSVSMYLNVQCEYTKPLAVFLLLTGRLK